MPVQVKVNMHIHTFYHLETKLCEGNFSQVAVCHSVQGGFPIWSLPMMELDMGAPLPPHR